MLTRKRVCASYFENSLYKFRHLTIPMQTLRKKNSPCKFKKEPTRFLGEGVSFKAKLIGILEVSEARGDRMCQAALADLKMAIRAAGEHKQRIAVQVSIDGLRLRDEKTGECLYHHPVHKISFIAQDMSDSRAFGYIFGSPDTGHRFFGIKTDKAANQVVIAMRDLFQVVFELKKKEIELTKQNIEQNASKFHISGIFVEPAPDTKDIFRPRDGQGAAGTEGCLQRIRTAVLDVDKASLNSGSSDKKNEAQSGVIADLLDLQFELNSLQQGIHQMDKITPDNPRPSSEGPTESDPFGDSFANMKVTGSVQPILPPPPFSSKRGHLERQQTIPATPSSVTSSPAPHQVFQSSKTPPPEESIKWLDNDSEKRFSDGEIADLTNVPSGDEDKDNDLTETSGSRKSPQIDVFTELDPLGTGLSKPYVDRKDFFQHLKNPPKKVLKDLVTTNSGETFPTNFDITLDPLDPIKVRTDATQKSTESFEDGDFANFEKFDNETEAPASNVTARISPSVASVKIDSPQQSNHRSNQRIIHHQPLSVCLPPEDSPSHYKTSVSRESSDSVQSLIRIPSPKKYQSMKKKDSDADMSNSRMREWMDKSFPVDFSKASEIPVSPLRSCSSDANSRLSSSSAELDIVPEPPPRGLASIMINPPPLPPKKQGARGGSKPPPRPPHNDSHLHYDFIERRETSPSPTRRERTKSPGQIDDGRPRFDDNFSPPSPRSLKRSEACASGGLMQTSRFDTMTPTTLSNLFRNPYMNNRNPETFAEAPDSAKVAVTSSIAKTSTTASITKPSLNITLSQLTSSNLDELATSLDMSVGELANLTLQQLTECLAKLTSSETNGISDTERQASNAGASFSKSPPTSAKLVETSFVSCEPLFKTDFDQGLKNQTHQPQENPVYDKYAVFRELLEMEQLREQSSVKESEDAGAVPEEQSDESLTKESVSTFSITGTIEIKDGLGLSSLLSMGNLSVDLPPLNEQPKRELNSEVTLQERTEIIPERISSRDDEENDAKSPNEHMIDIQDPSEPLGRRSRPQSNNFEDYEDNTKSCENLEGRIVEAVEGTNENGKANISREDVECGNGMGDGEEEEEEEDDDDEDEEEEEEEEDEEYEDGITGERVLKRVSKTTSEMKLATSTLGTKDRYAALREIEDEPEPKLAEAVEELPSCSLVTSPIQQETPKTLAEHDLLKLFSEPAPERVVPRKTPSRNEDDLRAVSTDIFEEIRMLNCTESQPRTENRTSHEPIRPPTAGFEDVFCPFTETKPDTNKDGRESTESAKDEGNWAKFESPGVFNSDKSSYEDPVSVGGTSPWSPDEKDFQMEGGLGDAKPNLKMQQQQQRLHSGESDNEWKDEEESEESNGRRQFREDPGFCCGRYPRFDLSEEGPYYDDPGERGEKERHFYERERERGSRKSRGGPWPKPQPGSHRARDSSPWHEEPASRGWPRDEEEQQLSLQRGRYSTGRKQIPGNPYKEEEEEPSKSYWKCRTKQRVWNGDREGFRNSNQQPGQQPPHFPGDPMFYEDDRTKRRMMLWSEEREEERERDRFSSQESMGYDEEERWPRREYDRRRDRWEEEIAGSNRFWMRRGPVEGESRSDMRLDPRSDYGPLPPHEPYRKQHYCRPERGDHRERSGPNHEMYPPVAPGGTGCWPENEYSLALPFGERPENSPRYLTRKCQWPKRPNSANDERNMAEPVYAEPRVKYGMSRSECSDNDSELYHRPYRSRSRESYWGSDQEFDSWTGAGSGSERLYWSEGPDAKSETLHRRRMNRHKNTRPSPQKSQSSPFEDDFTESIDRIEPPFESFAPDASRGIVTDMDVKQPAIPRNVKEHLRKDPRTSRYNNQPSNAGRMTNYADKDVTPTEGLGERSRIPSDLKTTPEDLPSELEKNLGTGGEAFVAENTNRDTFFNGNPSPGFEDDAFAFKSEMADSVPETTSASMSMKNSRQFKYGNNKTKGDHDIKKSESVNIFVRESDPFDDDDFFK